MSYLLSHVARRSASAPSTAGARVDLYRLLNSPGYYADAHVHVYVEDTAGRKLRRWRNPPAPHIELEIADCVNEIRLEFDLSSAGGRENSLFKIDTLLDALQAFRSALAAEAELYAQREHEQARRHIRSEPIRN
jgi:hypothetical protein